MMISGQLFRMEHLSMFRSIEGLVGCFGYTHLGIIKPITGDTKKAGLSRLQAP
jgi:hypothetical protein